MGKKEGITMELVFDDNLITGNELIDTQHKELISRISRFVASCEAGEQNKVQAIKMLDYMNWRSTEKSMRNSKRRYLIWKICWRSPRDRPMHL